MKRNHVSILPNAHVLDLFICNIRDYILILSLLLIAKRPRALCSLFKYSELFVVIQNNTSVPMS